MHGSYSNYKEPFLRLYKALYGSLSNIVAHLATCVSQKMSDYVWEENQVSLQAFLLEAPLPQYMCVAVL